MRGRRPAEPGPLTSVPCGICRRVERDWLVFGWDESAEVLSPFVGIHAVPVDLVQTEFTLVCRNGHGMTLLCHGRPAVEVLAASPDDVDIVWAVWASVAGGKTMLAKRWMRIILPIPAGGPARRVSLHPMFDVGIYAMIPKEPFAIAEATSAMSVQASRRKVLEAYLQQRIDADNDVSAYLDGLLVAGGESRHDARSGEDVANTQWGTAKHPLVVWHEVDRGNGRRANLRLLLLDEPGELQGGTAASVDPRAQAETLQSTDADAITWIVDLAISSPLLNHVHGRPLLEDVVRASYRPDEVKGEVVDLRAASEERQAGNAAALDNTVRAASGHQRPVGVVLTKADLVASVLQHLESDPGAADVLPLRTMLGEAGWSAAISLAARGLVRLASYWLQSGRVELVHPQAAAFLRDLVHGQSEAVVREVVAGIATHFGRADSFWGFVNDGAGQSFSLAVTAATTWRIEPFETDRDRSLAIDETPLRLSVRDLVCTVLGRMLLAGDYDADHVNALEQVVPERYFLVSLLTDPFVTTRAGLESQLRRDATATVGLKHAHTFLIAPAVRASS